MGPRGMAYSTCCWGLHIGEELLEEGWYPYKEWKKVLPRALVQAMRWTFIPGSNQSISSTGLWGQHMEGRSVKTTSSSQAVNEQ